MFTGIITDVGTVRAIDRPADTRLTIETRYDIASIAEGASIAVNGVCLTVVARGPGTLGFDVSSETLAVTALSRLAPGSLVNLERSLKVGDELGGHIVTGHVDGVGELLALEPEAGSVRLRVAMPDAIAPFVAKKGSIALDGISLTVNAVEPQDGRTTFTVNIIPHTQQETTLRTAEPGQPVNLEIDILARYVARLKEAS